MQEDFQKNKRAYYNMLRVTINDQPVVRRNESFPIT